MNVDNAGARLREVLSLIDSGPPLRAEDLAQHFAASTPGSVPRALLLLGQAQAALGGEFETLLVEPGESNAVFAHLRAANEREWRLGALIEAASGLIRRFYFGPWASDVTTRPARDDEGLLLQELERQAPIVMGEASVVYDRGADYFAGERLMGSAQVHVLERDGQPIGVVGNVIHDLRVGGQTFRASYGHRIRIARSAQGSGALGGMSWSSFLADAASDGAYGLIAAANQAMLRVIPAQLKASVEPERVIIPVLAQAMAFGRTATEADRGRIIELLNATHEGEECFVPYTSERLQQRLTRAPDVYSWSDVRMTERAVVGVWPSAFRVHRTEGDDTQDRVRALVLDYGFEVGAEDEFASLLRAVAGEMGAAGSDELAVFTSAGAPGREVVVAMAERVEPFVFSGDMALELDPASTRPIYVDQLYF